MTGSDGLPVQARHEACGRLVDLGLYAEARDLLSADDPQDAAIGARICLLAADAVSARRFLGTLEQMAVHPGLPGFLHACTPAPGWPPVTPVTVATVAVGHRDVPADSSLTWEKAPSWKRW